MTSVTQKEDEGHDSEEDECVVDEEPGGEGMRGLACFGHFCLEENYDKLLPPANCTNVTVHSFLFEIFEVDDMNFDISLDVRFELSWIDDRIKYKEKLQRVSSNILRNQSKSRTEQIVKAPITLTDNIWLPSLILRHMKRDNMRKGFFSTPASVLNF